jgi:tRNA-2-methylthio-N6-dimethylallyladenosine synthase
MRQLTDVVEGAALRSHEARVGEVEEVLLDGPSKRDDALWSGRSRHNKLVHVAPPAGEAFAPGEYITARVNHAAPHWLRGDLVARVRPPRRRRVRIPVSASPS